MFKAISNDTTGVLVEKKSKFIADVFYVESELEAEEKLKEVTKTSQAREVLSSQCGCPVPGEA